MSSTQPNPEQSSTIIAGPEAVISTRVYRWVRVGIYACLTIPIHIATAADSAVRVAAQSGGALRSIGRGVSINDRGDIGFMAGTSAGHNIFCINGENGERRSLMNGVFVLKPDGAASSQTFSEYVQVNNQREVAAQRRMNAVVLVGGLFGTMLTAPLTYVERWPCDGNRSSPGRIGLPNSLFAMGDGGAGIAWGLTSFLNPATGRVYPSPFNQDGGFAGVMGAPTINNSGQVVCTTLRDGLNWFITTRPGGFLGASSPSGVARAQLADNGFFTLRVSDDLDSAIYWFSYDFGTFDRAVDSSIGFGNKSLPGVDDAGTLLVFCADLSAEGAAELDKKQIALAPINPGPGLFWSKVVGNARFFRRLAGLAGNGYLDPGETWVDANHNEMVDAGEDRGLIGGFNYQSRACVNQLATGFTAVPEGGMTATASSYLAAFAGTTAGGAPAVFTVEFPSDSTGLLKAPTVFAQAGDPISSLNGTPAEFELHDAVNKSGAIACWTRTSSGAHAILSGRARSAKHVHVLTHGFGNPSPLQFGPIATAPVGFPDFLSGWETMKAQIAGLPAQYGTREQQEALDGAVVSYVSNWPSTDGWIQAVLAVTAMFFAPEWAGELLSYATENMDRAAMHAEGAAERIVSDLYGMGILPPGEAPQIHLIGHSRGAAVNSRVARLLYSRGITPAQYTSLDGYSPDWPSPSDILSDLDIVVETAGIPGIIRKNVRVDDGFDELVIRLILNLHEEFSGYIASWIGIPIPRYADATVAQLKPYLLQWKAPFRVGFDNYVLSGCPGHGEFTHHMSVIDAYAFCNRPSGLRALMDGPLGTELRGARTPKLAVQREAGGTANPASTSIRDGDFETVGKLADAVAAKPLPPGLDPVIQTLLTAMKKPEFILSSSWTLTGNVTIAPSGNGHAVRLEQTASGSTLAQTVRIPQEATAIEFDVKVLSAKPDDILKLMAGTEIIGSVPLSGADPAHVAFSLFGFAGKLATLSFGLAGNPAATPAAVSVDNIKISTVAGTGEPKLSVAYNRQDGTVDLTLTGTPGRTFRVQASDDLVDWIDIDSPMNFSGSKLLHDVPPDGVGTRFYRVAW